MLIGKSSARNPCSLCKVLSSSRITSRRRFTVSTNRFLSNRIYTSVRNAGELDNLLSLSSSSRQSLITLWTASWCSTCKTVAPVVQQRITHGWESDHSLDIPPVGFAEVEMDAPDMTEVNARYTMRSVPMLLAFSRGEPQMNTIVTDAKKMSDETFLAEWIKTEARRAGKGEAGGGLFGSLFGSSPRFYICGAGFLKP